MTFRAWFQGIDDRTAELRKKFSKEERKEFDKLMDDIAKSYNSAEFSVNHLWLINTGLSGEGEKHQAFQAVKSNIAQQVKALACTNHEDQDTMGQIAELQQFILNKAIKYRIPTTIHIDEAPLWLKKLRGYSALSAIPVIQEQPEVKHVEPRSPWVTAGFASFGAGYVAAGIVMGVATGGMALLAVGAVLLGVGLYRGAAALWDYFNPPAPAVVAATVKEDRADTVYAAAIQERLQEKLVAKDSAVSRHERALERIFDESEAQVAAPSQAQVAAPSQAQDSEPSSKSGVLVLEDYFERPESPSDEDGEILPSIDKLRALSQ